MRTFATEEKAPSLCLLNRGEETIAERRTVDFLVKRSPREVLNRAGVYLLRRGFGMPKGGHTDTTMLFTRSLQIKDKGLLSKLLSTFNTSPIPLQRVRLVVSEAGERRTRLTVIDSSEGECPTIQTELEQWVTQELGGAPSPHKPSFFR
jgi:hypothetical protein